MTAVMMVAMGMVAMMGGSVLKVLWLKAGLAGWARVA
jgi:hypothetical protein